MDVLIGAWECDEHGEWWGRRSDSCTSCPHVAYKEVPIVHEKFIISGHADGWLDMEWGAPALLEIKSIGLGTIRMGGGKIVNGDLSASFALIEKPFEAHVRQASLYVYCLQWMYDQGIIEDSPPEQILFIYENKADQAPREFLVPYRPEVLETTLDKLGALTLAVDNPPECTGKVGKCACGSYE